MVYSAPGWEPSATAWPLRLEPDRKRHEGHDVRQAAGGVSDGRLPGSHDLRGQYVANVIPRDLGETGLFDKVLRQRGPAASQKVGH